MSLINKMLQDLDARGGSADGGLRQQQLHAVEIQSERSGKLRLATIALAVVALGGAGWYGWHYWQGQRLAHAVGLAAAPQPAVAPVAAPSQPVASAVAAAVVEASAAPTPAASAMAAAALVPAAAQSAALVATAQVSASAPATAPAAQAPAASPATAAAPAPAGTLKAAPAPAPAATAAVAAQAPHGVPVKAASAAMPVVAAPASGAGAVPAKVAATRKGAASASRSNEEMGEAGTITHNLSPKLMAENTYRRGLVALQEGRTHAALGDFERALEIDPRNEAARQTYISLLLENKRNDDAVRQLRLALGIDPRQPGLAMILARLQLEKGGPALQTLMTTLPYAGGNPEYQAFLAGVLQREQRHAEAAQHYRNALQLTPQNGVWWMGLGISLQADNHPGEAREAFRRARAANGLSAELQTFIDRKLDALSR
ncbi:tetratricopeptide repeat protein [Duganella fentianensis]|uniref:tetratricopeptide repeat protein n=1 Tax=Duganella fentianensis TaxID=2692177 RepID=UPI0032B27721